MRYKEIVYEGVKTGAGEGNRTSYRAWEALVLPLNYARFEMRKAL